MVNETEFLEGRVLTPKTFPTLDWKWFNAVPKWYWTYWSQTELIRTAAFMKQVSVEEVKQDDIALPNNCWMDTKTNCVHGFGVKDLPFKFIFYEDKGIAFADGKHHVVFSDNASFAVGITTWGDGDQSWVCWNTKENVDPGMKKEVMKIVTGLGFKAEMAVETPFKE